MSCLISFRLDDRREVKNIHFSNVARAKMHTVPVEKIQPLFKALWKFNDLCYDKDICVQFKLKPGEHYILRKRSLFMGGGKPLEGGGQNISAQTF